MGTGVLGVDAPGADGTGAPDSTPFGDAPRPLSVVDRGGEGVRLSCGGVGVELCGRRSGGNSSGGIDGVVPGANGRVGHGNGDNVRVLVPVDGKVGGNSVVAQPGGPPQLGGGTGCGG